MWIARNKIGKLYLFSFKPVLDEYGTGWKADYSLNKYNIFFEDYEWGTVEFPYVKLNRESFPEVTFENSPVELVPKISKDYIPVEITDGYDAGWLSPDGEFYGCNGDVGELLHMKIVDALRDNGIIEIPDKYKEHYWSNPDGYLSLIGWAKIHYDNVLYNGYMWPLDDVIHMTEKQREAIAKYGEKCYNNYLCFSPSLKERSMSTFEETDKLMLWKLFDYE